MKYEECKVGTRVKFEGVIVERRHYDRIVKVLTDSGEESYVIPSVLQPAEPNPKYDPSRPYRRGDLVRIVGFGGRLFGYASNPVLANGHKIGDVVRIEGDEDSNYDVKLPNGYLYDSTYPYIHVACVELVEAVDDQKEYIVKDGYDFVCVLRRKDKEVVATFHSNLEKGMPYEEAHALAEKLCAELNEREDNNKKAGVSGN